MRKLVSPLKVHKTEKNDVLIYEPDLVLISMISKNEFDILLEENKENKDLLSSIYVFCSDRNIYRLRTLPSKINKEQKKEMLNWLDLSNFYEHLDDNYLHLTSAYVPLHVEEALRKAFMSDISIINNEDKKKIVNLKNIAPVHSYFIFNDTKNEYFYKKKHEHIPGMMLVEAARQAVYDYIYTNSGYALKEISISMSNLNVKFLEYTVSSYPLELLFSHREYGHRHKPKNIEKRGWFYQRGKLVGIFSLEGGIIPMSIFPRLRNEKYDNCYLFYPFNSTYVEINNGLLRKKVIYLSTEHITIEASASDIDQINISEVMLENIKLPIKEFKISKKNSQYYDLFFESLNKDQYLNINNLINTSFFNKSKFEEFDL
ncbi:AfsA-related hotdog domain-containing protein [Acinetobacter pittii]|uniref:AfsA-related hotdog domain-containing protein n=1 Tax=Acinetobacter pittii TaxID=48296 RepID=UPI0032610870